MNPLTNAKLDEVEAAIRPLWEKARAIRGDCFRDAEDDAKDRAARDGYYFFDGLENAYRDALNAVIRARKAPTLSPGAEQNSMSDLTHSSEERAQLEADPDFGVCDRCGGEGVIEYSDGDGGDWGEDCPSEENHLIICRACHGTGKHR